MTVTSSSPSPPPLSLCYRLPIVEDCSKSESHRCELACCGQTEINFQPRVQFFQDGRDLLSVERAFSAPECDWNRENGEFKCKVVRNSLCKRSIHTCVVTQGPGSVYSLTFSVIGKSIVSYADCKHNHDVFNVSMQLDMAGELTTPAPLADLLSLQMSVQ